MHASAEPLATHLSVNAYGDLVEELTEVLRRRGAPHDGAQLRGRSLHVKWLYVAAAGRELALDLRASSSHLVEASADRRREPSLGDPIDQAQLAALELGRLLDQGTSFLLGPQCLRVFGQGAALYATDPPYGVGYDGTSHPQNQRDKAAGRERGTQNRDWSDDYQDLDAWDHFDDEGAFEAFLVAVFTAAAPHVQENAA